MYIENCDSLSQSFHLKTSTSRFYIGLAAFYIHAELEEEKEEDEEEDKEEDAEFLRRRSRMLYRI